MKLIIIDRKNGRIIIETADEDNEAEILKEHEIKTFINITTIRKNGTNRKDQND